MRASSPQVRLVPERSLPIGRNGIGFLALTSGLLLVVAGGAMNTLVPLFAIGVFVGFTLSQAGMVRHWLAARPDGWRGKVALNGFGALLTAIAAVVVTMCKFTEGGWLILIALPALVLVMERVNRAYRRIGEKLELGCVPAPPRPHGSLVIVPVGGVTRLTCQALAAALSLGDRVVAVRVVHPDEPRERREFLAEWERWDPGVAFDEMRRRRSS
ncbi:hypothetical protein ABZ801_27045 [Actinomadura sp. NPDC047616]|uniref:hypothetical protein n=1 Tax=Actinomadura sp. NPDC047616 TaxID=3155914 RepID=UPI0033D3409F